MNSQTENLNHSIGRRISELRKQREMSQHDLASKLSRRRTQSWVSNVESGRRNLNNHDLFEITAILGITPSGFFDYFSGSENSFSKSLGDSFRELSARLPIEMPVFLQRELGDSTPEPIDYQYQLTCRHGRYLTSITH
jgi:transcriptional regulator with XRE-family HTH domain